MDDPMTPEAGLPPLYVGDLKEVYRDDLAVLLGSAGYKALRDDATRDVRPLLQQVYDEYERVRALKSDYRAFMAAWAEARAWWDSGADSDRTSVAYMLGHARVVLFVLVNHKLVKPAPIEELARFRDETLLAVAALATRPAVFRFVDGRAQGGGLFQRKVAPSEVAAAAAVLVAGPERKRYQMRRVTNREDLGMNYPPTLKDALAEEFEVHPVTIRRALAAAGWRLPDDLIYR